MGRVVALMDDLFFQMKLAETAKRLGVQVKVAANPDALLSLLDPPPKLVIIDFGKYEGKSVQEIQELDPVFYTRLASEKENGIFAIRRKLFPLSPRAVFRDVYSALRGKLTHHDLSVYNAAQRAAYLALILALIVLVLSGLAIWKPGQKRSTRGCRGQQCR